MRREQVFVAESVDARHFVAATLAEYVVEHPPAGIVPEIVRDSERVGLDPSCLDSVGSWPCERRKVQNSKRAGCRDSFSDLSGVDRRAGFNIDDAEPAFGLRAGDSGLLSHGAVTGCGIDDSPFHGFPAGDFVGSLDFLQGDPVDDKSGGIVGRSDGTASVSGTEP